MLQSLCNWKLCLTAILLALVSPLLRAQEVGDDGALGEDAPVASAQPEGDAQLLGLNTRYPDVPSLISHSSLGLWICASDEVPLLDSLRFDERARAADSFGRLSVLRTDIGLRLHQRFGAWSADLRFGFESIALRQSGVESSDMLLHGTRSFGAGGELTLSRRFAFNSNRSGINPWGFELGAQGRFGSTFFSDKPESEVFHLEEGDTTTSQLVRYGIKLMLARDSIFKWQFESDDDTQSSLPKTGFNFAFGALIFGSLLDVEIKGDRAGSERLIYAAHSRTTLGAAFPLRFESYMRSGDHSALSAGLEIVIGAHWSEFSLWMGMIF